ncbi:MAG TPA: type IIL restriction-modification enzyme MmeI, partial [Candidatus Saccharimonadales bacterium]
MSQIAWNEVQDRAQTFAAHWANETRERAESQTFWSEFLTVFGVDRRRHGAFFEYAVKKGSGGQGFIDMFWPGRMLAEQKSGGKDLAKAKIQAF